MSLWRKSMSGREQAFASRFRAKKSGSIALEGSETVDSHRGGIHKKLAKATL